jgi:hypothetical protein
MVLSPYDIDPVVKANLIKNIARRLTPQAVKIRADIEVTCFAYEGIEAIKAALKAGEAVGVASVEEKSEDGKVAENPIKVVPLEPTPTTPLLLDQTCSPALLRDDDDIDEQGRRHRHAQQGMRCDHGNNQEEGRRRQHQDGRTSCEREGRARCLL